MPSRVGSFSLKSSKVVHSAIIDVDTSRKVENEVKSALAPPSAALTASKVPASTAKGFYTVEWSF